MENKEKELVIACIKTMRIYSFTTETKAKEDLEIARAYAKTNVNEWTSHCKEYPNAAGFKQYLKAAKAIDYKIMEYSEFLEKERAHYLKGEPKPITKEEYQDAINVLPPLYWGERNRVELFSMSEFYTGVYTIQYAHDRRTDTYYSKLVDAYDSSTWIDTYLQGGNNHEQKI